MRQKKSLFLDIGWCSLLQAVVYSDGAPKGSNTPCQEQWTQLVSSVTAPFLFLWQVTGFPKTWTWFWAIALTASCLSSFWTSWRHPAWHSVRYRAVSLASPPGGDHTYVRGSSCIVCRWSILKCPPPIQYFVLFSRMGQFAREPRSYGPPHHR